jgi:membrane associated rhomboid family serine protease
MATCYRHPRRETAVACSNCERPICPDCMTPTPVGMRCPECARQTTQVKRMPAGIGGGRAPATYVLIAINVAAFVVEIIGGGVGAGIASSGGKVFNHFALFGPQIAAGDYWRLLTGAFLHAGLLHLAFNMYALYILGSILEPGIGTPRFVALYFASLFAGSLGALILTPDSPTVGASGAIFGLMSATFIIARQRGVGDVAQQIGFFILLNLLFSFSISGISIGGHLGGLIGGAIAAFIVVGAERRRSGTVALELAAMIALSAAAIALSLAVV